MKLTQITAVAMAVLLVGAGAAAAIPGQAADEAQDEANTNASDADAPSVDKPNPPAGPVTDPGAPNGTDGNESANASERRGPPGDMPAPVPDHVSQIHDAINSWLDSGKEGSLGDVISDIVGGGDEADEQSGDGSSESTNTTETTDGQ